jgi:hypothetical protein
MMGHLYQVTITGQELADMFGRSIPWVTQYMSLLKLDPKVQTMLNADLPEGQQIGFSYALEIAKLPADNQEAAARHILAHKMNLFRARHYVRTLLVQFGSSGPIRKRDPHDEVRVIRAFIERTLLRVDELLNPPGFIFSEIFRGRPAREADEFAAKLSIIIQRLQQMQQGMRRK